MLSCGGGGGGGLGLSLVSVGLLGLRPYWHVWLFGHSVGGLFDCTKGNFLFLRVSMPL